jgi:hypothetical protein
VNFPPQKKRKISQVYTKKIIYFSIFLVEKMKKKSRRKSLLPTTHIINKSVEEIYIVAI